MRVRSGRVCIKSITESLTVSTVGSTIHRGGPTHMRLVLQVLLATGMLAAAQSRDPIAPTSRETTPLRTASIRGRVVDDRTPAQPVSRASIFLTSNSAADARTEVTDETGSF